MKRPNSSIGKRVAVVSACILLLWGPPTLWTAPPAATLDDDQRHMALPGIHALMDGDFDRAVEVFRQVQNADPNSPLGYLLEADANWWKIYLVEGNLVDPDVFESRSEAITPYDADFRRLTSLCIQKAEANVRAHQNEARSYLYEGLGYALLARLEALRDQSLATARAGKKLRNLSLLAVKLVPNLNDAYLGIGLYNYFVATLPGYVKMLRFLIGLPGGNRELGLQQLQQAADRGEVTAGEAKFHLAKNLSRHSEMQYAKSLELFRQLMEEYPHHQLWRLLVGSLEIRLGQTQEGEAQYREVVTATAALKSEVWQPLRQQAEQALARRGKAATGESE
jgi:tetratricopeptide (TPR) repeat protein